MALSGLQQLYPYLGAIEKAFDAGSGVCVCWLAGACYMAKSLEFVGAWGSRVDTPFVPSALLCVVRVSRAVLQVKPLFRLDNPQLHQALFALSSISDSQLQGACNRLVWILQTRQQAHAAQHTAQHHKQLKLAPFV